MGMKVEVRGSAQYWLLGISQLFHGLVKMLLTVPSILAFMAGVSQSSLFFLRMVSHQKRPFYQPS